MRAMVSDRRRRGPAAAGALRAGDHACLVYGTGPERLSVLRALVTGALAAHEKVLFFGETGDRELHELAAAAEGRFVVGSAAEWILADDRVEPARMVRRLRAESDRAHREGHQGLRLVGEMSAALRDEDAVHRLLHYEALLAREFRHSTTLAVCQYDVRCFGSEALRAFASAHPRSVNVEPLVRTAELRVIRLYQPHGLRIEGVIDVQSHRHLREALESVAETDGDVHLDLSGLEFLDLGGLRLLMNFARSRVGGQQVELAGLAPHLQQVITLVGWDDTPGLRLGAGHAG
jgi:anti-anti-sigma factor